MPSVAWDIRRSGRAWRGGEAMALLENVGIDAAVRLGDPGEWKAAVADLAG